MFKRFISLEWKAFTRSASFKMNLALKILMIFGALYFIVLFAAMGALSFFMIKEKINPDPIQVINK